jgi:hypothetical protein
LDAGKIRQISNLKCHMRLSEWIYSLIKIAPEEGSSKDFYDILSVISNELYKSRHLEI